MSVIHVDTHVAAWLYAGDVGPLRRVRGSLEANDLVISPMVELELQFLFEIGRTRDPGTDVVRDMVSRVGLRVAGTASFHEVIQGAASLRWTRDPFDRLIVAHAITDGAKLLTSDRTIPRHCPSAFWA